MRKLIWSVSLLTMACDLAPSRAQVPLDTSGREAALEFIIVDPFGKAIENAEIRITRLVRGRQTDTVVIPERVTLEYGLYRVSVQKPGFESSSDEIAVDAPTIRIVLALPIGDIEKAVQPSFVRARFDRPPLESQCRTVHFVPMFLKAHSIDVSVTATGIIPIEGAKAGAYMAVLVGPSGVCRVFSATILQRDTQDVVLRPLEAVPK